MNKVPNYFEHNTPTDQRAPAPRAQRPREMWPGTTPEQLREAEQVLRCFDQELTLDS